MASPRGKPLARAAWALAIFVLFVTLVGCFLMDWGEEEETDEVPEPEATSVGEPSAAPLLATMGPAGGEVDTGDGRLVVRFPPGALASDVDVSITPIENRAHGGG